MLRPRSCHENGVPDCSTARLNLEAIARAYTRCVEMEERATLHSEELAEDLATLRADLHALLMNALRETGIPFADRADAARLAFEFVMKPSPALT